MLLTFKENVKFSILFLPTNVLQLSLWIDNTLFYCCFTKDDTLRVINKLDPNKTDGLDKFSLRM